ncbi:MAG: VOC family protein [Ignavibacteriaceae bacterium]
MGQVGELHSGHAEQNEDGDQDTKRVVLGRMVRLWTHAHDQNGAGQWNRPGQKLKETYARFDRPQLPLGCLPGNSAVFLSAGGYHHHIALNTWAGKDAPAPPPGHTGLYHFAILYPTRKELARVTKRIFELNYKIEGASDHGVSESVYLRDPDGNGVELYSDRPERDWPVDSEGNLLMETKHLDIIGLLSELDGE